MQATTDIPMVHDLESPRYAGSKGDDIQRLQNISLILKHGLGCEIRRVMQAGTPHENRINLLRREDAIEPPLDTVENSRLRKAVECNAQSIRIVDLQEKRKIIGMEELLLRGGEQRNPFSRYVLGRCTNMYIIAELNWGIKRNRHRPEIASLQAQIWQHDS